MDTSAQIITGALAAVAAGVAAHAVPVPLLEMLLASTGISEIVPQAAPPLGATARLLVSGTAALFAAAIVLTILPGSTARQEEEDSQDLGRGRHMGMAFSKLTALARGRRPVGEEAGRALAAQAPILRRADAHPDAPARSPIVASRDFGEDSLIAGEAATADHILPESLAPAEPAVAEAEPSPVVEMVAEADAAGLDMPRAPEPMPWDAIKAEMARIGVNMQSPEVSSHAQAAADTSHSITSLTERLERGLQRRREREAAFLEATTAADSAPLPAPSVQPDVQPTEEAPRGCALDTELYAALATLRGITAKAG